jgi:hypothetical protein
MQLGGKSGRKTKKLKGRNWEVTLPNSPISGKGLFASFGSMSKALKSAYPEFDWEESKFSFRGKKSEQRW